MSAEIHLRKGELPALFYYLFCFRRLKNPKVERGASSGVREIQSEIRDMTLFLRKMRDGTARIRNRELSQGYEDSSSFGRNFKEIFETARAHIRQCPECRRKYESYVKNLAYRYRLDCPYIGDPVADYNIGLFGMDFLDILGRKSHFLKAFKIWEDRNK